MNASRKLVVEILLHEDALHADTALAGLIERAEDHALDDEVQAISLIRIDDAGGVAAEFEHNLLPARARLQIPADGRRAGKRQQLEAVVGREQVGAVAMRRQDRERAFRQIRFGHDLAHDQRPDRRAARWLEHERTADCERRRNLVCGEVQRKVERRDERARPDRHALGEAAIAFRPSRDLEVDHFAIDPNRLLGRDLERIDQPRDFTARILDRLARLDAQRHRQFVVAFAKALDTMFEHGLALVGRHLAAGFLRLDCCRDTGIDRLRVSHCHARGNLAGVLVGDFEIGVWLAGFVREIVRVGRSEHDRALLRFPLLRAGEGGVRGFCLTLTDSSFPRKRDSGPGTPGDN